MSEERFLGRETALSLVAKMNIEILSYDETPLGPLCLRRRELLSQPGVMVTEVTLNHEFLMSSLYTDSEQALSRMGVDIHGGEDLNVMVAGLGLGYSAYEALKSENVAQVEVVELLPQVIGWLESGLIPLADELRGDPRLSVTPGDAYRKLADVPDKHFDLILVDIDHSPDDRLGAGESAPFYTPDGLMAARKHLRPHGVLGVWSYAESTEFSDSLRATFKTVIAKPITHQNELIHEEHTDWLFFATDK